MKKPVAVVAAVVVVLVLVGSFVVYPAVAANKAEDTVQTGLDDLVASGDVKLSGVSIDVEGGNAFNRVFKGEDVGDIDIKIDRIEIPEGAAQGEAPQIKSQEQAEASVRSLLDQFERVGTVSLTLGKITSGSDQVDLNNSSVSLSDGTYGLTLNVAKKDVNSLLEGFGATLELTGSGNRVEGTFGIPDIDEATQDFSLAVTPQNGGRDVELEFNGEKTVEKGRPGDPTLTKVEFGSEGDFYSISLAGTFDWAKVRSEFEKELASSD